MKIILLQDEKKLGKKGDVIDVSDGYARNYVLPKKIGIEATAGNMNDLKLKKANEDKRAQEQMEAAIKETIRINEGEFQEDDENRIMIDVTRGLLSIYEGVVGTHKGLNIIIADFPLRWTVRGMGELFDKGINAVILI